MSCIPKVINYCWFGGAPLPDEAIRCIDSWKKYMPDYKIIEWNESNFDITICDYVKEAYEKKRWAFVSDYARFWILYNSGGLYFDTDVEIIKPLDDLVKIGSFMGIEKSGNEINVAPGLGICAVARWDLFKELLNYYNKIHFCGEDGRINNQTVVAYTTEIFVKHGFRKIDKLQNIGGMTIYPHDYFCPMNYITGEIAITKNTYTIHHYSASWHTRLDDIIHKIESCTKDNKVEYKLRRMISLPFRVAKKTKEQGYAGIREAIKARIIK